MITLEEFFPHRVEPYNPGNKATTGPKVLVLEQITSLVNVSLFSLFCASKILVCHPALSLVASATKDRLQINRTLETIGRGWGSPPLPGPSGGGSGNCHTLLDRVNAVWLNNSKGLLGLSEHVVQSHKLITERF